jgi:hypothetical protein
MLVLNDPSGRSSAEKAKEEMDGFIMNRHDLRVQWGKAGGIIEIQH